MHKPEPVILSSAAVRLEPMAADHAAALEAAAREKVRIMIMALAGGGLLLVALAGLLSAVQSWRGWAATERAMRLDAPMPRSRAMVLLVVLLVLVAVAFIGASLTT